MASKRLGSASVTNYLALRLLNEYDYLQFQALGYSAVFSKLNMAAGDEALFALII